MMYVIRIQDGGKYRDLDRADFVRQVEAVDWFNACPMQRRPIHLLAEDRRIIVKRPANT